MDEILKAALIVRAKVAKEKLGSSWRSALRKVDSFYGEEIGIGVTHQLSTAISGKHSRIGLVRLAKITKSLEKAAGIVPEPIEL